MLKATWEGVLLELKARPGAGRFALRKGKDGLVVSLRHPAASGKANRELLSELGTLFGCEAEIVEGISKRKKLVLLRGALLTDVERKLAAALR